MSSFFAHLPLYVLATLFFGVIVWALLYGLPLALWRAVWAPGAARFPQGKALALLASGLTIGVGLAFYLGSVPFGAMPCGPRFPCPVGADFVHITQDPLSYLFKAGPLACILLLGVLLVVVGGRSLLSRDAA
jgi:hypothetical protein